MGVRHHGSRRRHALLAFLLALGLIALSSTVSAFARGGVGSGEHWIAVDAAYLKRFPAEVRSAIAAQAKLCGPNAAVHPEFARYIQGAGGRDVIALHYHHMRCAERSQVCSAHGCLHQVFAPGGGGYHRVLDARIGDVELTLANGQVSVRSECRAGPCAQAAR